MSNLIKPQAGSGGANLRSTNQVDPATLLGTLKEGVTLEVIDQSIAGWYGCKVFASTQVFAASGNTVALLPNLDAGNLRSAANTDPSTVVAMLKPGQKLQLISASGDWLQAKVFVSADVIDLITQGGSQPAVAASPDRFDAPIGSDQERASSQIWPGAWIDAASFAAHFQARPAGPTVCSTGAHLQLPNNDASGLPVLSTAQGVVRFTGADPNWGLVITIEHPLADGTRVWSRYAYLDDIIVRPGDNVSRGQLIGHVGNGYGKTSYQLHFDIAKIDLTQNALDWPGNDENRVRQSYLDPKAFIQSHRGQAAQPAPQPAAQPAQAPAPAPQPQPATQPAPQPATPATHAPVKLKLGLHDSEGGDWMIGKQIKGVTLAAVAVQDEAAFVDFTAMANAGIDVILRVNYGWADGTGTIAPPAQLAKFEKAAIDTINAAKGIVASIYCNEINNPQEAPGFDPNTGNPGPNFFELTPDYYIASYNRVFAAVKPGQKLGPAPLDPYFGPQFPWVKHSTDNREWWRAILKGINGAGAFFFHGKTQGNGVDEIRSDKKFDGDPLRWQYVGFRTMETYLVEIPDRFKDVPFYITEANPQRISNGQLGWDPNNAAWITECMAYLKDWNADPTHHPVTGVLFYRWQNDDWALQDKTPIKKAIIAEAAKL